MVSKKEYIEGLPVYIFENLNIYGDTVITMKYVKRLGIDEIHKILKKHGYDCEINEGSNYEYAGAKHVVVRVINKVRVKSNG